VRVGDLVQIAEGPFAGLEGRLKASGPRVLIVLEIHGRQFDVEMDLDWLRAGVPERRPVTGIQEPDIQQRGKGA